MFDLSSTTRRLTAIFLAVLSAAFFAGPVGAQELTPQQLERLRNLTPDQKSQLLEIIGESPGNTRSAPPDMPQLVEEPPEEEAPIDLGERGIEPGMTLIIEVAHEEPEEVRHAGLRDAIGSRVYRVDANGMINFPRVGSIPVAGLSADEVSLRLHAEADLVDFEFETSVLSLAASGADALKPFGYDLFDGAPTTFAPATDVPVPVDYVLGVGDTIVVRRYGNENDVSELAVGRDGRIVLPNSGPIAVAGLPFSEVREQIKARVENESIGVNVLITMGELRSIRVFVLGDVNRPGSYTVSSLSTMTNAMFVSGGLRESGSMRDVQLKRQNRVVGRLDLYELLLKGNTRQDRPLKPGDVIFVPPVGTRVSIHGNVLRPAIYELTREKTLSSLVALAGGFLPSAYESQAQIQRFNDRGLLDILSVGAGEFSGFALASGDVVHIPSSLSDVDNSVRLLGHVRRTLEQQWRPGMRLRDLIFDPQALRERADPEYILIHRRTGKNRLSVLQSANLQLAFERESSPANVALAPGDEVIVFSLDDDRSERIKPYLDLVRSQASLDMPSAVAKILGQVRAPGDYPLEPGMTLRDLVRAAGGLRESAYIESAELTRQTRNAESDDLNSRHMTVALGAALAGDPVSNVELRPFDFVTVREIPQWREHETIELRGEVRFPGVYAVRRGEFLSSVIERAGGLTTLAFTEGSIFLREELREREREQLERLAERVRREVNAMPVDQRESRDSAESLLEQLEESDPVGRLVIDLDSLLASAMDVRADILVKDGDRLIIPPRSQEVTVIGEVQYATSHIFSPGLERRDYILKSGGATANADRRRIYVVRANGNVVADSGSRWFRASEGQTEIRPGDTIVVPLDADRISNLSLWSSVTQIVYNIGVAAAAVGTF
ncbi:MAG: SLBB domain-containing protein [Pseudomonadota bacterium]